MAKASSTKSAHRLVSIAILAIVISASNLGGRAALSLKEALAMYASGDYANAIRDLDVRRLTVAQLTETLDKWIAIGDAASKSRRRTVASAFALDAVWS